MTTPVLIPSCELSVYHMKEPLLTEMHPSLCCPLLGISISYVLFLYHVLFFISFYTLDITSKIDMVFLLKRNLEFIGQL